MGQLRMARIGTESRPSTVGWELVELDWRPAYTPQ
jgi:hypothetical protein